MSKFITANIDMDITGEVTVGMDILTFGPEKEAQFIRLDINGVKFFSLDANDLKAIITACNKGLALIAKAEKEGKRLV